MGSDTTPPSPIVDRRALERLHRRADCARWNLTVEAFAGWIQRSVVRRFDTSTASGSDLQAYLDSLHAEDLALACACAAGHENAWEHFVREYRPKLYAAAGAISGRDARELADSLYADLYGLASKDGTRRSLFEYFHGRSSLLTWLRAVLARRHLDGVRANRKYVPLDEESSEMADPRTPLPDPDRERFVRLLQAALAASLAALEPRDRLRLASYYVQDLTLAQIGRLHGEHEATVSRKLEKTRRLIRQKVERHLRDEAHLTDRQVRLCFEYAVQAWPFDMTGLLSEPGT